VSIHPSDILFYAGGAALRQFGTLSRRTTGIARRGEGVIENFARTGTAYFMGKDGLYHASEEDVFRPHWVDADGDGILDTLTLLLEDERENELLLSSDFGPGPPYTWSSPGNFIITSRTSIIDGQTAYEHERDGGSSRIQSVGTFTGDDETCYLIVENVDASVTRLRIYDATGASYVAGALLTWSTGAITLYEGTGAVFGAKLLNEGPNGGEVYLFGVTCSGTVGHTRHVYVQPVGDNNSVSAILHHCQLEEAGFYSSPIVTDTAAVTRNAEALSLPLWTPPRAMTIYAKLREVGSTLISNWPRVCQIGGSGNNASVRIWARLGYYTMNIRNSGGSSTQSAMTTAPSFDDIVELRGTLSSDGSVQLHQSINVGDESSGPASGALALDSVWGGHSLYINYEGVAGNNVGHQQLEALIVAPGSQSLSDFRALLP